MQQLDNEFFEAYKRLERLCSDMYGYRSGISQYIAEMECQPYRDQLAIPLWDQSYKQLKHLRWVRNQIAHDSGAVQICTERDIRDVNSFYHDIISGQDPLTTLRKYRCFSAADTNHMPRTPTSAGTTVIVVPLPSPMPIS